METVHVCPDSHLLRQVLHLLSVQRRIQLFCHIFDPIDERIDTRNRRVDKELEADLLHNELLIVGQIGHLVIQLQCLAEGVLWKRHLVLFRRNEEASVLDLLYFVRVGLEQRLVQIESLEVSHGCRYQIRVAQLGHLRRHMIDVPLKNNLLELDLQVEFLDFLFNLLVTQPLLLLSLLIFRLWTLLLPLCVVKFADLSPELFLFLLANDSQLLLWRLLLRFCIITLLLLIKEPIAIMGRITKIYHLSLIINYNCEI